jgi:hypothetical protein
LNAKFSVGDVVYYGHATTQWEVIDVQEYCNGETIVYTILSLDEKDYKGNPYKQEVSKENLLNFRTIYDRLAELENYALS